MKTSAEKIEHARMKQREYAQRAIKRQRELADDPEYREERYRKNRERLRRREKEKRRAKSRGLKGRTPLAYERRMMDKIGALPCIACYVHGVTTHLTSLHHINGRTAPDCHAKQLSLCAWHHQNAAPQSFRFEFPWLVPVHADGICGGKAAFESLNGTQEELYNRQLELIETGEWL